MLKDKRFEQHDSKVCQIQSMNCSHEGRPHWVNLSLGPGGTRFV